jgi:hypothetical protein
MTTRTNAISRAGTTSASDCTGPRTSHLARRAGVAFALAVAVAAIAPTPRAVAAPDSAIASAVYGEAEIWLQRKPSDRTQRELVFQQVPSAEPRVLDVKVPPRNKRMISWWGENLALGLDGAGKLTAVLQSDRGLYWTHVTGTPRMRRVPATTRKDTFPSLFRGRVAYGRFAGENRSIVRLGALRRSRARTVWTNRSSTKWVAQQTAIGAGNTVAIVTLRDGAGNGARRVLLARSGRPTKRLQSLGLGHFSEGGLWIETSRNGRRLTVTRTLDDATTAITYALPSGRRLRHRRRAPTHWEAFRPSSKSSHRLQAAGPIAYDGRGGMRRRTGTASA